MTQTRLVKTTTLAGLRPLGLHGQPAIDSYRQLAAVLENRLGPDHAALFARPERRRDGGIDWFTDRPGAIRSFDELDEPARRSLEADLNQKLEDVAGLARALGEVHLARLLRHAVEVAGPQSRLAVGDRPLLILWGFASEREAPGVPRHSAAVPPAPALASLAAAPWGLRDWWRWLLLALLVLLAVLLALRACAPLPADQAESDPEQAAERERADLRGKELERQLAALREEREKAVAACTVPPDGAIGSGEPSSQPEIVARGNAPVSPPTETLPPVEPTPVDPTPAQPDLPELAELPEITEAPSPGPDPAAPEQPCIPPRHPSEAPEVALVVDSSGSMEAPIAGAANRLEAAKRAIGELLDGLPADVDVGLVEFRDCERIRRDRFYSGNERGQLKTQIQSLEPGRGTPLARSVERAGSILSSQVPGVIIVVTDGKDSCGGDPCAAARAIKQKRPNLVINVIDIGSGGGSPAACMAEITGGRVYKPGSAVQFDEMIAEAGGQPDIRECR